MTTPGAPPDRPTPRPPDHELRGDMMQKPLFGPKPQPAAVPGTNVTVDGEVVRVTYENDETGFRVLRVNVEGCLQSETWVGVLPTAAPGTRVRATGRYERYGDQLKVETMLTVAPSTMDGIERYLGSGVVPALIPPPRFPLQRLSGVFAPRSRLRAAVIPQGRWREPARWRPCRAPRRGGRRRRPTPRRRR